MTSYELMSSMLVSLLVFKVVATVDSVITGALGGILFDFLVLIP